MCGRSRGVHKEMFFYNKKKKKKRKNESVQQRRRAEGWNSNGICDKVTFKEISTPSPLNEKVLS